MYLLRKQKEKEKSKRFWYRQSTCDWLKPYILGNASHYQILTLFGANHGTSYER
jgi:hypothetical protein